MSSLPPPVDNKVKISCGPSTDIRDIFDSLSYGPCPESADVANAWLDDHKRKLGHFIDNKWVIPAGRKTYDTKCPATGQFLASTIQGEEEDVNEAVAAASKSFETWSKTSGHYRARILYSIARHVQKHQRLVSVIESLDNGKPIRESRDVDIPVVVRHLYHHAGWAQLMDTEMSQWKPVGVVGAIVPWNFPLMLLTWKVCPALAMGNTVVLKPATYTRLSALLFAEICAEAGLPPGVFNVVTGPGSMGSLLATHPLVDKVAFTGSTEIGQVLRRATAGSGKKLSLELGGKSPVIVFESADIDSTIEGIVDAIWLNQGQVCSAGSRLLVQESVYETFVSRLKTRMTHLRLGDCLAKDIDCGALVDEAQQRSIEELVQSARDEGAEVYQSPGVLLMTGLYYPPTLITGVQTVSRVVVEEIFGPVAVVLPFRTAKEAIEIGNNTRFGLAASVWSESVSLALEVAMRLKAGTVWINAHNLFDAAAGFGGFRHSGFGRDGGKEGLYEYVRPKWEDHPSASTTSVDLKTFGNAVPCLPTITDNSFLDIKSLVTGSGTTTTLLSIDRTYKMYYGGAQQRPDAQYARPIINPDGKIVGHVGEGSRKDIRNAVESAHSAAQGWGKRAAHNRAQIVFYLAENLELRRNEFAQRLASMTGCTEEQGRQEVDASIARLFHWGAYADKYGGTVQETTLYGATVKINEPIGVIGIACPDECPLLAFISLLAPAVVRSNCVVIVPSEKYPLLALDLYQVFDTSDLPGGVVNIITGDRDHLTKYLTEHQDVQAMWYFGPAAGSKFVEYTSADSVKRTWVNYGMSRDWFARESGEGEEFLYHATQPFYAAILECEPSRSSLYNSCWVYVKNEQ